MTLTTVMPPARRVALLLAAAALAVGIWAVITALAEPYDWSQVGTGHDARPYWTAASDAPYQTSQVGAHDAYLYSPVFLQALEPLRALPWQAFLGFWTAILIATTVVLAGPVLAAPVLVLVLPELYGGNISLLLALAIVAGYRWPAAWAFVLLTKVTPGVGLLWFAVRREWRSLGIALGATALIAGASFVVAPDAWREWTGVLAGNAGAPIGSGSFAVPPLLVRLPLAAILVAWGARSNRPWVLPVAALIALPVIWYGSLTLLVGVIPLLGGRLPGANWSAARDELRAWFASRRDAGEAQAA